MKATLEIDAAIMQRLRDEAKRRGTTMTALAEAGIWRILSEKAPTAKSDKPLPELSKMPSGTRPADTCNKEELRRMVEEYLGEPLPETAEELFEKLPKWNSGGELVDITNREELYRVMDEYDGFRY